MGLTVVVVDLGEKVEGGNLGFDLGMKERKEAIIIAFGFSAAPCCSNLNRKFI